MSDDDDMYEFQYEDDSGSEQDEEDDVENEYVCFFYEIKVVWIIVLYINDHSVQNVF